MAKGTKAKKRAAKKKKATSKDKIPVPEMKYTPRQKEYMKSY